jgi:hypothetical protein
MSRVQIAISTLLIMLAAIALFIGGLKIGFDLGYEKATEIHSIPMQTSFPR